MGPRCKSTQDCTHTYALSCIESVPCMAAGRALGDARQPQKLLLPKPYQVMDDGPPLAPRRAALPPQLSPAKPELLPPNVAHHGQQGGALFHAPLWAAFTLPSSNMSLPQLHYW